MTPDQKTVAKGAFFGVSLMTLTVGASWLWWPLAAAPGDSLLIYTLRAHLWVIVTLLAPIVAVGNRRFLTAAIDPLRHAEDRATQIDIKVVDNTLEQTVIFIVTSLALATEMPAADSRLIAGTVVAFVLARIAFWVGYRIHPLFRAAGMAGTIYLNFALTLLALWRLVA